VHNAAAEGYKMKNICLLVDDVGQSKPGAEKSDGKNEDGQGNNM